MRGDRFSQDDSAISPVVGVLLMLALTVLLGATAATFFIGLSGENVNEGPPTAKFSFEYHGSGSGSDSLTVTHESGENAPTERTYVKLEGAACDGGTDDPNQRYNLADDFHLPSDEMRAGHSLQIRPDTDFDGSREICTDGGDLVFSDSTVRIVWDTENSATTTIYSWTGP